MEAPLPPLSGFLFIPAMSYTSCVPRIPNDQYVTIRASYVRICNGNPVAAALISYFETWHNYKLKQLAEWEKMNAKKDRPNMWQHHTGKQLERGIMGIGKRHSIDQAKQQLLSMGIIVIGRNPDYKFAFDATLHYQFQPEVVAGLLAFVENSKTGPFVEIDIPDDAEISNSGIAENGEAIPNYSTDQKPNDSIPADAGGGQAAPSKPKREKKKRAPGAEPDLDWQRWVDRYDVHVKKHNEGIGHNWSGSQLGDQGLKGIRKHLVRVSIKTAGMSDDDCGFGAWCYILDHWDDLGDDWLQGQFDLTVILKKITDILNRLKNGGKTHRAINSQGAGRGTSGERISALADY